MIGDLGLNSGFKQSPCEYREVLHVYALCINLLTRFLVSNLLSPLATRSSKRDQRSYQLDACASLFDCMCTTAYALEPTRAPDRQLYRPGRVNLSSKNFSSFALSLVSSCKRTPRSCPLPSNDRGQGAFVTYFGSMPSITHVTLKSANLAPISFVFLPSVSLERMQK
jgi:hypothetical protein